MPMRVTLPMEGIVVRRRRRQLEVILVGWVRRVILTFGGLVQRFVVQENGRMIVVRLKVVMRGRVVRIMCW